MGVWLIYNFPRNTLEFLLTPFLKLMAEGDEDSIRIGMEGERRRGVNSKFTVSERKMEA